MQKAYILRCKKHPATVERNHIVSVFSSLAKAREAIKWLIEVETAHKQFPEDLYIEIYEINGDFIRAINWR